MSDKSMIITCNNGMVINTDNKIIALAFWHDGAMVEYSNGNIPVFTDLVKKESESPKPIYPVWLTEHEKNNIIAHWEKTGMFSSIIPKIRAVENTKRFK